MNDALMPDWIRRIKDQDEAAKSSDDLKRQSQILAGEQLLAKGPDFWKQLTEQLEIAATHCASIGIRATCSHLGPQESKREPGSRAPRGVRLELTAGFPNVRIIYTNIWYTPGNAYIGLFTLDFPEKRIDLRVSEGTVCALVGSNILDPEGLTQAIMERMARYVRGESTQADFQ
jgi:hypothetical protein